MQAADIKTSQNEWTRIEQMSVNNDALDPTEKRFALQQALLNHAIYILRKKKRDIPIVHEDEEIGLTI